jgi:hypothetical protein
LTPSAPLTGPLSTGRRVHSPGAACHPLGIGLPRFRRLARLGLLRSSPGGGYDVDELRGQYAGAVELEERVAAIAGESLTPAERNSALAFLLEGARRAGATRPEDLRQEVARALAVIEERSFPPEDQLAGSFR